MEPIAKQLVSAFAAAWNESAPQALGCPSELALLAEREVSDAGVAGALAVAATWSAGFFATGEEGLPGVVICLFKDAEGDELERLARRPADGAPKPGGRALVGAALKATAEQLAAVSPTPVAFGEVRHLDLTGDESRLAAIVGDRVWVGTFSLSVADRIDSQIMFLYAPAGTLDPLTGGSKEGAKAAPDAAQHEPAANPGLTAPAREEPPRNIERLLDVELDVIVRFGVTYVPLRSVVRMGLGTMIELNRAVEEPVELLVNGRSFARGEVVVVDGYYGVRITEIGALAERARTLL